MEFHVAGELQLKACLPESVDIYVLGVVAGLKNGELVMAGVVGGDCRDKMADRLPRSWPGNFCPSKPHID